MATAIKCGNCKGIHESVEAVKACYSGKLMVGDNVWSTEGGGKWVPAAPVMEDDLLPCEAKALATGKVSAQVFTQAGITAKQEAFLNSLLAERPMYRDVMNYWPSNIAKLTKAEASTLIGEVKAVAKEGSDASTKGGAVPTLDDGIYRKGDQYVLVYHTVHGQNVQVGKVLIVTDNGDGTFSGEWDYRGRNILRDMDASMKLTQEEAKHFGQVYGLCVRCAATLTKEESKHVGYGSTCAGHEGWWYPTKKELKAINTQAGV